MCKLKKVTFKNAGKRYQNTRISKGFTHSANQFPTTAVHSNVSYPSDKVAFVCRKMLKAQLKSNFDPTFLLSLKKKTDVEERESLQLERE